jgi:pantoate--beta-alanine ligase
MEIINSIKQIQECSEKMRSLNYKIAFVPTMGFLHAGHLSLIKIAKKHADKLIISIFVNPSQFAPNEDYDSYPKDIDRDIKLVKKEGVDIVFLPQAKDLYPNDFQSFVSLEKLPNHLCGISRPTHFRGVATIVTKLFNIVKPHYAIFGEKDYQQLAIIKQLVSDFHFNIKIIGGPIIREHDGLAMSSRNSYLTPDQRESSLCLYHSIQQTKQLVSNGEMKSKNLINSAKTLIKSYQDTQINYLTICDPITLDNVFFIDQSALFALSVKVGKVNLIDNSIIKSRIIQ